MPVIMRLVEGSARIEGGKARVGGAGIELPKEDVNVELVLSAVAACIARRVSEAAGSSRVEVYVSAYGDLDKVLEGKEEIEYLEVVVKGVCGDGGEEALRRGVEACPIYGLLKGYVRRLIASCYDEEPKGR